jgi:hypothetical protein
MLLECIETRKARSFWESDLAHGNGYNQLSRCQWELLMPIGTDLVNAVDRVYMAVRQMSAGEAFTAAQGGIPPVLPVVPPALASYLSPGVLAGLRDIQGVTPPGWFGSTSTPVNLSDVVKALRAGEPSEVESILGKLDLLGDATDLTTLYGAVKGTVADVGLLAEGGGTLAVLMIATMAQIQGQVLMQSVLADVRNLLTRLNVVADGNGAVPFDPPMSQSLHAIDANTAP